MNAEVQRCTTRIAQEEIAQLIRNHHAHKVNAAVRAEWEGRLRQAIGQAISEELDGIRRELPS